jgi:hypothetical protein
MKVILKLSEHGDAIMLETKPETVKHLHEMLNAGVPVTGVYNGLWIESNKPNKPSLTIIVDAAFRPAPTTDNSEI